MAPNVYMTITLAGDQLLSQLTGGQRKYRCSLRLTGKFFTKRMAAQLEFVKGGDGKVTELILHQYGMERPMKRLDDAEVKRIADESAAQAAKAAQRFKEQQPAPGSEAALRRILEEWRAGQPKYELLSLDFADFTRQNLPGLEARISMVGAIESVTFKRVDQSGADVYEVKFEHNLMDWSIALQSDGKITNCKPGGN
jgi:hypothetical protein